MKRCAAFDLGASGGKMMLGAYDGSRLEMEEVHRFEHEALPLAGGLYWDFTGIWQQFLQGLNKAAGQGPIASIGADSFCNDFAIVAPNGDVLTQMRCYRDERTTRRKPQTDAAAPPEWLQRRTGNQTAPFGTLMQLAAMGFEGQAGLFEQGTLLHLPDLLCYLLSERRATEFSIASVSQMLSLENGGWDDEILARFAIPRGLLAPLAEPGTLLGPLTTAAAAQTGLAQNCQVATTCHHDTASAVAALPTGDPDAIFISSGTWSLVGVRAAQPIVNDVMLKYNLALEGGAHREYRLLRNVMGLWLVQECRRDYRRRGQSYSYAQLEDAARGAMPFRSLVDPDAAAFFAPGNMCQKISDYCSQSGQPAPETPGQMIRCVAESLALKYRWVVERLRQATGRALGDIHIIGGGGKDALLCQFTANACGRPVHVGPGEAALCGNLLLQLQALGEVNGPAEMTELAQRSTTLTHYQPQHEAQWQAAYGRFLQLAGLDE